MHEIERQLRQAGYTENQLYEAGFGQSYRACSNCRLYACGEECPVDKACGLDLAHWQHERCCSACKWLETSDVTGRVVCRVGGDMRLDPCVMYEQGDHV